MTSSMPQSMQEKLQALTVNYLKQLEERLKKIERCADHLENKALSLADRADLQIQAHKLSGTGATYGFPKISACGNALEEWLIEHTDNAPLLLDLTHSLIAVCREALRSAPSISAAAETPQPVHAPVAEAPLLLIVDDDADVRNTLTALFTDDARIMTATNSEEAVTMMTAYQPDLVLLDDMMPGGVSGLRMLEDRRAMPAIKNIPVIMITASKKKEEVMRGLRAGAADYIAKPFDPADVRARVGSRLKRMSSTILVADDDASVREMLNHKFNEAGLRCVCVRSEREAWEVLQSKKISLALVDRMMPEADDGLALLNRMKKTPEFADIPVVFLTARYHSNQVAEGVARGVADYIVKPFSPHEVVTRCLRLLNISNKPVAMKE
jgi:two-component system, cell cycle response regulator